MNTPHKVVDVEELSHFKTMSTRWWDKTSGSKPLHSLNELRVPLVREGLINTGAVRKELVDDPLPLKDILILEVGCGGGILTEALAKLGSTIVGIDLSPDLLDQANEHAALDPSLSNLKYLLESVEDHAINNYEKYDAIVASEVLEHVPDPKIFLEHCVKCLKPGGSIFITTINKTMTSLFLGIIFAEYIWGFIPRGTHHWNKFISPTDTRMILESSNCQTRTINGMLYNFLGDKWHWASTTSISYALHAVKHLTLAAMNTLRNTIDADELSHFAKLSTWWWDKTGTVKPLHSMNELRVPLVRDGLIRTGAVRKEFIDTPMPLTDLKILEVGCGGGILTEALAKLGCTTVGIDLCPELIEQASKHAALDASLSNLKYSLESVEDHAINNYEKYDAVVASEVLEHVSDPKIFLENCVKCLKAGGSIFITTVNKTMTSLFLGIIFAEYIWGCIPRGTHKWNKFIAPTDTRRILESYNCQTRTINGFLYNFLGNKWLWASTTSINYALHAVKN